MGGDAGYQIGFVFLLLPHLISAGRVFVRKRIRPLFSAVVWLSYPSVPENVPLPYTCAAMSLSIESDCSSYSSSPSSSSSLSSFRSHSSGSPGLPSNPSRRIRPILPANPCVRNPKRDIITTSSRNLFIPPKNVHVKAACDACRRRKVKVNPPMSWSSRY